VSTNIHEQVQPGSHCPITTLSPDCMKMQYNNMKNEKQLLHCCCQQMQEMLEKLSMEQEDEIMEDQDPNGYNLIQKVYEFIDNNANAYNILLSVLMQNMC